MKAERWRVTVAKRRCDDVLLTVLVAGVRGAADAADKARRQVAEVGGALGARLDTAQLDFEAERW